MEDTVRDCIIQYRRLLPHCQGLLNKCLSEHAEKTSEDYLEMQSYVNKLEYAF